jgi:hypothetical protein
VLIYFCLLMRRKTPKDAARDKGGAKSAESK